MLLGSSLPLPTRSGWYQKRNRLLADLQRAGYFDAETLHLARAEPIPTRAFPYPVWAPHLSRFLKNSYQGQRIRTTINADLQQELEALVRRHLSYLDHQGIGNGAALLVETGSGNVRAYVGSRDFFNAQHQGQVDGVIAPRSSGSLLKPFLYALSIDDGLILPQTLLKDVPTFYHGFSPSNANEHYDGLVRAGRGSGAIPQCTGRASLAALWCVQFPPLPPRYWRLDSGALGR